MTESKSRQSAMAVDQSDANMDSYKVLLISCLMVSGLLFLRPIASLWLVLFSERRQNSGPFADLFALKLT